MYLALDIELVALDLQYRILAFACLVQDETLLGHVHFDLFKGDVSVLYIVRRAEFRQVLGLSRQSCLDLEDVEKGLAADLSGMRAE